MEKKLAYRILVGWFALSLGQAAFATVYKVELIVFAQYMPNSELFDQTGSTIKWPAQLLEITAPAIAKPDSVAMSQLTGLSSVHARLAQHNYYKVLLQTAWLQPIDNSLAPAVHFKNAANTIDGFMRITAGPSLTVQVDAEYTPINNTSANSGKAGLVYRLTESRRLMPNEMHYFDHPSFGIITLITPVS